MTRDDNIDTLIQINTSLEPYGQPPYSNHHVHQV